MTPYLERGSCWEWKQKESLVLWEAAKVLRCVRVYEKENKGEMEKGRQYCRLVGHTVDCEKQPDEERSSCPE